MATNREDLKGYFNAGDRPTENQFGELIDNTVNKIDDKANLTEASVGTDDIKYITAKTAKKSVETFAANSIPSATISTQGKVELATLTEVQTGTDTTRVVTPQGAKKAVETFAPVKSVNGLVGDVVLNFNGTTDPGSMREGIVRFSTGITSAPQKTFHLKLPYKALNAANGGHNKMFYIKASGYSYYTADIIDIVWVGYCYGSGGVLMKNKTSINMSTLITAGQYIGSDSHIYLWFKISNIASTTFKLDSMCVGTSPYNDILEEGDIEVIISNLAQL